MLTVQCDTGSWTLARSLWAYHSEWIGEKLLNPIVLWPPQWLQENATDPVALLKDRPTIISILVGLVQLVGETARGIKDPPITSNLLEDNFQWKGKTDVDLVRFLQSKFPYPETKDQKDAKYTNAKFDEFKKTPIIACLHVATKLQMKQITRILSLYFAFFFQLSYDLTRKSSTIQSSAAPEPTSSASMPSQEVTVPASLPSQEVAPVPSSTINGPVPTSFTAPSHSETVPMDICS